MEENNKFTKTQEETIYEIREDKEDSNNTLLEFFNELIKRRRKDPFEGGLQAVVIIYPDKCAMKICEKDGTAPHSNAAINLVKYLNNDKKYISILGTGFFTIYAKENKQLIEKGIEIRILDGEEKLMLAIMSKIKNKTEFQIKVLTKILLICKKLKEKKTYKSIETGIHTPTDDIDFDELTNEHYENIIYSLNNPKINHSK